MRPEYDSTNNRIRGWVLNDADEIADLLNSQNHGLLRDRIEESRELAREYNADRILLRGLTVNPDQWFTSAPNYIDCRPVRASVDVAGLTPHRSADVVYFEENGPGRRTPRAIRNAERQLLRQAGDVGVSQSRAIERARDAGYTVEVLDNSSNQDVSDIAQLMREAYERDGRTVMWYEPTTENIREVVNNSRTAVSRNIDDRIVSAAIAEQADFPTEIGNMRLYEISDCATSAPYRSQGLLQANVRMLLNHLLENSPNAIFSEARACNFGINRAFHRESLDPNGFLERHVLIGGHRDVEGIVGDIEDFNVWNLSQPYFKE